MFDPRFAIALLVAFPGFVFSVGAYFSDGPNIGIKLANFLKRFSALVTYLNLMVTLFVTLNMAIYTAESIQLITTDVSYYLKVNLPAYDSVDAINSAQSQNSFNNMVNTVPSRRVLHEINASMTINRRLDNTGPTLSLVYHTNNWDNLLTDSNLISVCKSEQQIIANMKCLDTSGYKSAIPLVFNPQTCQYLTSYSQSLYVFGLSDNAPYVQDNIDSSNPQSGILLSYFHLGSCGSSYTYQQFYDSTNQNCENGIKSCNVVNQYFNAEFQDDIINAIRISLYSLVICSIFMVLAVRGLIVAVFTVYSIFVSTICAAAFLRLWGYGTFSAFNFVSIFILLGIGANAVLFFGSAWREAVGPGNVATARNLYDAYYSIGWSVLFTIMAACVSLFSKLISPVIVISQLGAFLGVAVLVFYVCFHSIIIPVWIYTGSWVLPAIVHRQVSAGKSLFGIGPKIGPSESGGQPPAQTAPMNTNADLSAFSAYDSTNLEPRESSVAGSYIDADFQPAVEAEFLEDNRKVLKYVTTSLGVLSILCILLGLLAALYFAMIGYSLNYGLPQLFLPASNLGQVMIVAQDYRSSIFTSNSNTDSITFVGTTTAQPTILSTKAPTLKPYAPFVPSVVSPTFAPSVIPPSWSPSREPSGRPSRPPTTEPTMKTTPLPTARPSKVRTALPITLVPTSETIVQTTSMPTSSSPPPSSTPTVMQSSATQSIQPTISQSAVPSFLGTSAPIQGTSVPIVLSLSPSVAPTASKSFLPSLASSPAHSDYSVTGCWGISWTKTTIDGSVTDKFDAVSFGKYSSSTAGLVADFRNLCTYVDDNRDYLNVNPNWNRSIDCIDSQYDQALNSLGSAPHSVTNALLKWASTTSTAGSLLGTYSTDSAPYLSPLWVCANFSLRSYVSSLQSNPAFVSGIKDKWQSAFTGTHSGGSGSNANQYGVAIVVGSQDFAYPILAAELVTSIELAIIISIAGIIFLLMVFTFVDVGMIILGTLAMVATLVVTICCHIYFFARVVDLLDVVVLVALMSMIVDFPIHCLLYFMVERQKANDLISSQRQGEDGRILQRTHRQSESYRRNDSEYSIPNDALDADVEADGAQENEVRGVSRSYSADIPSYEHVSAAGESTNSDAEGSVVMAPTKNTFSALKKTSKYMSTAVVGPLILSVIAGLPLLFLSSFSLLRKTGQYILILSVVSYVVTCVFLPHALNTVYETHCIRWVRNLKCSSDSNDDRHRELEAAMHQTLGRPLLPRLSSVEDVAPSSPLEDHERRDDSFQRAVSDEL